MRSLEQLAISSMILFFIFLSPWISLAEDDSIWFAGMNIKIGMAKSLVLSEIAKYNEIAREKEIGQDMWRITSKVDHEIVGSIGFKDDKVVIFNKIWDTKNNQAMELVKNLYYLLSNLEAEGKKVVSFKTGASKEPEYTIEMIDLSVGHKQIHISCWDYKGVEGAGITEIIK